METRQATIEDLEGLLKYVFEINQQHINFNPIRFSKFPNHRQLLKEHFEIELRNTKSIIIVLFSKSEIVGYSYTKLEDDSLVDLSLQRAWLHDIFVDDKMRGQKGGQLLLDASKKAAKTLGSPILMLQVAKQNDSARRIFQKNGFEETTNEMMLVL
ncbi:GNAT family N-acetyltransferase [Flavobacterium plurextorum]|uniref:GNAT family N-acetyltransferase n=1 Tax=Flavobacterium TaxID=237 RepID=UPI00214DBDB4|nr:MULTISPECIES: GNAT family N-acetyltransferase [Flavobacterium]UUW08412.1 GNAT family N-acetyltransferase [Flavobacterium plurextorum]